MAVQTVEKNGWKWSSSDDTIATIAPSEEGTKCDMTVVGNHSQVLEGGDVTIKLEKDGFEVSHGFGVLNPATGITVEPQASVEATKVNNLGFKLVPAESNDVLVVTVDDPETVKATLNGRMQVDLLGLKVGQTRVTITAKYSKVSANVDVTVREATVPVTAIALNPTTVNLAANGTQKITATLTPPNPTDKSITWSSDHADIAAVDQNGTITWKAPGSATITAKANGGTNISATVKVTCANPPLGNLAISATQVSGGTTTLSVPNPGTGNMMRYKVTAANAKPTVAYGTAVTVEGGWTNVPANKQITGVAGGQVVTVVECTQSGANARSKGEVTLVNAPTLGALTVTATAKNGGQTIAVSPALGTGNKYVYIITADNSVPTVAYDQALTTGWTAVTAAPFDVNGTAGRVITVAEVTADGKARKTGKATLPAALVAVTGVTVAPTTASVEVGKTVTIAATFAPTTASNKNVTWSTSDNTKATVANGVVTGKAAGSVTITATSAADATKKATATVTVTAAAGA